MKSEREILEYLYKLIQYKERLLNDFTPDNEIDEINAEIRTIRWILETSCKYNLEIPNVGLCCEAYYKSKRNDGLEWMHFPFCSEKNCPLKHPELLQGATLKKEM